MVVWQIHYLAEALEEHGTEEVVGRNLALEALKKEVEALEAEKARLEEEIGSLDFVHTKLEDLGKHLSRSARRLRA